MRIAFVAFFPVIGDNMFLLVRIVARDESHDGFGRHIVRLQLRGRFDALLCYAVDARSQISLAV